MSSHHVTEDATPETIHSTSFGEFIPPASLPLVTTDREIVAMATGVVRGQWEIPHELFAELPQRLAVIALGDNPRSAVKAAKLLIEMNSANDPAPQDDQRGHVVIYLPDNGRDPMPE